MTLYPGKNYVGSPIRLTLDVTTAAGVASDPDTVTLKWMNPDGRTTTYVYGDDSEIGRRSAGRFYADVTPDQSGRWHYRWETTGEAKAVAQEGDVVVQVSPFSEGQRTAYV